MIQARVSLTHRQIEVLLVAVESFVYPSLDVRGDRVSADEHASFGPSEIAVLRRVLKCLEQAAIMIPRGA